jgi:hypothetical protein
MFKLRQFKELIALFDKRKNVIKNTDKILINDTDYLAFISNYEGLNITPDIQLFGFDQTINANKYIAENFKDIAKSQWILARTGQGDEWFLNKQTQKIVFYDHNQGEYKNLNDFLELDINFSQFIQMAFLLKDLEQHLDAEIEKPQTLKHIFQQEMNIIQVDLYEKYPYQYFE